MKRLYQGRAIERERAKAGTCGVCIAFGRPACQEKRPNRPACPALVTPGHLGPVPPEAA